MQCELCGKAEKNLKKVSLEGAILLLCQSCAKFGTGASTGAFRNIAPADIARGLEKRKKFLEEKDIFAEIRGELAQDYPERIRNARLKLSLTPEELGKRINERKTIITKLESGAMLPTEKQLKKLERALNIKLTEKEKRE